MLRKLFVSVLCVSLIGAGCDDGDDSEKRDNTDRTSRIEMADMASAVAKVFCDTYAQCAGTLADVFLPDCEAVMTVDFADSEMAMWEASITNGTLEYDAEKGAECIAAFRARGCDLFSLGTPDACLEAAKGLVAVNGACDYDSECAGRAFCDTSLACPGTCTSPLAENGQCSRGEMCQAGLTCDENLGTCELPVLEGDACGGGVAPDCPEGLFICLDEDIPSSTAGACAPISALLTESLGDACEFSDARFLLCAPGLICELTSTTPTFECTSPDATSGGSCAIAFPGECPSGEYCKTVASITGTCTSLPVAGEDCLFDGAAPECATGYSCDFDNDKCVELARIGDNCTNDGACSTDNCVAGTCADPVCQID